MEEKVYDGDDNSAATEQSAATCTETNGCTDACDDVVVKIDNLSKKYPRAKDYAVKKRILCVPQGRDSRIARRQRRG